MGIHHQHWNWARLVLKLLWHIITSMKQRIRYNTDKIQFIITNHTFMCCVIWRFHSSFGRFHQFLPISFLTSSRHLGAGWPARLCVAWLYGVHVVTRLAHLSSVIDLIFSAHFIFLSIASCVQSFSPDSLLIRSFRILCVIVIPIILLSIFRWATCNFCFSFSFMVQHSEPKSTTDEMQLWNSRRLLLIGICWFVSSFANFLQTSQPHWIRWLTSLW